jgi:hypothetical protein
MSIELEKPLAEREKGRAPGLCQCGGGGTATGDVGWQERQQHWSNFKGGVGLMFRQGSWVAHDHEAATCDIGYYAYYVLCGQAHPADSCMLNELLSLAPAGVNSTNKQLP